MAIAADVKRSHPDQRQGRAPGIAGETPDRHGTFKDAARPHNPSIGPMEAALSADREGARPLVEEPGKTKNPMRYGAVFNEALFLGYVGNNPATARIVASRFVASAPDHLTVIQTALHTGEVQMVARAAHGIKGAVSFFAASQVNDAARQLEALARAGDLEGAASVCRELSREMFRLVIALEKFLACASS